jgi:hypothetical protein
MQMLRSRIAIRVFDQISANLRECIDLPMDQIFSSALSQPRGSRRNQAFNVEFIRVHQESNQRFFVIRLIGDIGKNEDSRLDVCDCMHRREDER